MFDEFGNLIDDEVGYAWGSIVQGSADESRKNEQALNYIKARMDLCGEDSFYIFTGNIRENPLRPDDLGIRSEEWVGPALYRDELREAALTHVSGNPETDDVTVLNRTSAANAACVLAFGGPDKTVISYAPEKKHHPSVVRGGRASGSRIICMDNPDDLKALPYASNGGVCMITSVTSEMLYLPEDELASAINTAHEKGLIAVVDDAYGARIRPIILGFTPSLQLGADVIITNNDKAGLNGPRAGIVVGKKDLITRITGTAGGFGMEARAPIALAVCRSLQKFDPGDLIDEVETGRLLYEDLHSRLGDEFISRTVMGPEIKADKVLKLALKLAGKSEADARIVPMEASSALGMELLKNHGMVTTNACGRPGARVSVRLKTNKETINRLGGVGKAIDNTVECLKTVGGYADNPAHAKSVILG